MILLFGLNQTRPSASTPWLRSLPASHYINHSVGVVRAHGFSRPVRRSVGIADDHRMVEVGSLIWLHPEATGPTHHQEVQADCAGT